MTLSDIEAFVLRDFGYASAPASAVTTRIRAYINERHRRILTRPGLEKLRTETETLATVVDQAEYGLEMPVAKVLKITDTTNDQPLWERGLDWYRTVEPDTTAASGTSIYWIYKGLTPALRNIGGTGLWVVSTDAADAMTATVQTINTAGSLTTTTTTINGTTRAQIGTATTHQRLIRFSLSAAAAGEIELYDAATGGNLVSEVEVGRTTAQFVRIALWPTPSAVNTLQIDYLHHIRDMTLDTQEPQLPLDFHYLLTLGARIDEGRFGKNADDVRVTGWQGEYEQGIQHLYAWLTSYDTLFIPGDLNQIRRSNLSTTVAGTAGVVW